MVHESQNDDAELAAIAAIAKALGDVDDADARRRVLTYILARYMPEVSGTQASAVHAPLPGPMGRADVAVPQYPPVGVGEERPKEVPGIAQLTNAGDLKITARDLKAKSGLDAALRLAYIAIYAYYLLTGQPLSSRKGLTPLLREWRLYTGNTRARLAKERGIIREGDGLSLDAHARRDAEQYISEILSDESVGQWRPR